MVTLTTDVYDVAGISRRSKQGDDQVMVPDVEFYILLYAF